MISVLSDGAICFREIKRSLCPKTFEDSKRRVPDERVFPIEPTAGGPFKNEGAF